VVLSVPLSSETKYKLEKKNVYLGKKREKEEEEIKQCC